MGTGITEMNITNKHKKAFSLIVREVIKISDVVLEILDARYLQETRIPELEEEIKAAGKKLIYVINKADLADLKKMKEEKLLKNLKPYVLISAKNRKGKAQLIHKIKVEVSRANVIFKRKHVGIIGYPNTGKSSLINYLSGRGAARTSAEAHYTRGMQKIKLAKDLFLLDTPGIVPPSEDALTKKAIEKKGEIGIESYSQTKDPELVVAILMKRHSGAIEKFYGIDAKGDYEVLVEDLGRKFNFLVKKGKVDFDKTLRKIIKDWQEGKIR